MITVTLVTKPNFLVTVENFDGRCKRVRVIAANQYDAMAMAQKGGWYPVDVKPI